LGCFRCKSFV